MIDNIFYDNIGIERSPREGMPIRRQAYKGVFRKRGIEKCKRYILF